MNALLVADRMDFRGSTIYTVHLARSLRAHGHGVRIVARGGRLAARLAEEGIPVMTVEGLRSPLAGLLLARRVARWARGAGRRGGLFARSRDDRPEGSWTGPDVVHVQVPEALPFGLRVARSLRVPAVVTIHHFAEESGVVRVPEGVSAVIAISESVREDLVNHSRIRKGRIHVVPNGVPAARLGDARIASHLAPRTPIVCGMGSLERPKGFDYFIHAAALILREGLRAHFVIAGEGSEEDALRHLVRALGLARDVTFAEGPTEPASLLSAADVFVLSSVHEGLGQFLLEAMVWGVPIVAAGVGGVYAVVDDDRSGLIVPPRDPGAIARAVLRVLREPDLGKRLGASARASVGERYSIDKLVARTIAVYAESAERRDRPAWSDAAGE